MIKTKCQVEVVKGEKHYSFLCEYDALLPEVIQVLTEMKDHAEKTLADAIKKAEEAKANAPVLENVNEEEVV